MLYKTISERQYFFILSGILLFITLLYLFIYPNPIDWDGLERFNSAIVLHDTLIDYITGKLSSIKEIPGMLMMHQEKYRTGVGILVWPPLQVFLLTLFIFIFGKSLLSVYMFSYIVLLLILFFTVKILSKSSKNTIYSIVMLLFFFTNPVFLHHVFTLNLRFGEIACFLMALYCFTCYQEIPKNKYIYMITIISILAVFYRLTALWGVFPICIALLFVVKNKKQLIGPFLVGVMGVIFFVGLHFLQKILVGKSFLERGVVDRKYVDLPGFYTFYQFSDYYKGVSSTVVAKLAAARYKISILKKFVYNISSLFCTGIIFVFPKKIKIRGNILSIITFSAFILYFLFYTKYGAKPDYLLPMLFALTLFFILVTKKVNTIILLITFLIVVSFNLFATYTRYMHPYYEDINLSILEKKSRFFEGINTVYIADTPMKHLAYYSLIHDKMFKITEFSQISPVKIIPVLKSDEMIILNNEFNYRFQKYNYEHLKPYMDDDHYTMEKVESYKSHYVLIKKK